MDITPWVAFVLPPAAILILTIVIGITEGWQ